MASVVPPYHVSENLLEIVIFDNKYVFRGMRAVVASWAIGVSIYGLSIFFLILCGKFVSKAIFKSFFWFSLAFLVFLCLKKPLVNIGTSLVKKFSSTKKLATTFI